MEARCTPLDEARLVSEIDAVLRWIEQRPEDVVDLMFGWAYDVPNQWEWQPVRAGSLRGLLAESAAQGIYGPGRGDIHLRCAERGVEFTLCHESDVHVVSDERTVVDEFVGGWATRQITSWRRATADSEWIEA